MAFPAGTVPTEGFQKAQRKARDIYAITVAHRDESASQPIDRSKLIGHMAALTRTVDELNAVAAIPGIVQYARDQLDDQGRGIAGEFTAMVNAATTLRDWINANFPKAGGAWQVNSFDLYGNAQPLTFSVAALADYRTNCDTFLATIEMP